MFYLFWRSNDGDLGLYTEQVWEKKYFFTPLDPQKVIFSLSLSNF